MDLLKNGTEKPEEHYDHVKIEEEELVQETYGEASCPYFPESSVAKNKHLVTPLYLPKKRTAQQEEPDYTAKIVKEEFIQEMYGETSSLCIPVVGLVKNEILINPMDLPKKGTQDLMDELYDPLKIDEEEFVQETYGDTPCPYIPESSVLADMNLTTPLDLPKKSTSQQEENLGMTSAGSGPKFKIQKSVSIEMRNKKMPSMLLNNPPVSNDKKSFECNSCSVRFANRSNLVNHIRMHTGEKPFQCKSCTAAFAHRSSLVNHIRTHTGDKPFECNSCSARFTRRSHLADHIRTHNGQKLFECWFCSAKYTRRSDFVSHIRTHSVE